MIALTAEEARERWVWPPSRERWTAVSTDTRTIRPGDLFVALRGERFDGHDFVAQALAAGAGGAVVPRAGGAGRTLRSCHPPLSARVVYR